MVVVLAIATMVFAFAKPLCVPFMAANDFARRRNVWFALTIVAFLSPSFWLFVPIALCLLAWSANKDSTPIALYLLMMHVIPPYAKVEIPVVGINQLFELDCYRILAFAVLIPAVLAKRHEQAASTPPRVSVDTLLLAYGALQLVQLMPYESITNTFRRGFLYGIDALVLYFAVSRTCTSRRALVDSMATLCLVCALYAPLALFETLKTWQLYREIGTQWGAPPAFGYLYRNDILRAEVSTGHSLALGYLMAVAFGFWLYLRPRLQDAPGAAWGYAWMWMGLVAAYSRAPWLVAVCILFCYVGLNPKGLGPFFKVLAVATLLGGVVLASPAGSWVIDKLPFVGTTDAENVLYRQRLAEAAWELIKVRPLFGDPFFMSNLEDLRQGEGIIDLVNTFATVAMASGIVGLSLFLGPFLIAMRTAYRRARATASTDPDLALLGMNLIACMAGTLFMMATGSFGTALSHMYYVLMGLAVGYVRVSAERGAAEAPAPQQSRPQPGLSPRRSPLL